jgi:hypothetical protein
MEQGGFFNIPGLFGIGNGGFFTAPTQFQENLAKQKLMTTPQPVVGRTGGVGQVTQEQLQQGIGGAYNLETGEIKPTGLLGMFSDISDSFSNMSADETTNLLQGLSGLLSQTAPAQQELQRISIPSATAGLRLPEVDLMQYYKGLL